MQIRIDVVKNIKKLRSFKSLRASNPRISEKFTAFPSGLEGGVFGSVKLIKPKVKEAIATIVKVLLKAPSSIAVAESQWNM
jgi:hypothetical protein